MVHWGRGTNINSSYSKIVYTLSNIKWSYHLWNKITLHALTRSGCNILSQQSYFTLPASVEIIYSRIQPNVSFSRIYDRLKRNRPGERYPNEINVREKKKTKNEKRDQPSKPETSL